MASIAANLELVPGGGNALSILVSREGTAGHLYAASVELLSGKFATRNLADAVHYLCTLHGRHPGVVDHAATRTVHGAARKWLIDAVDGFAVERAQLAKLVVAAGPLPSTPGQAESEAAVVSQRHALEMLAQSDRQGCAVGAALALALDWGAVRGLLDVAADRFGVERVASALPAPEASNGLYDALAENPAVERAMNFGAHQLIGQHRGLWDLLEARQLARGEF